MGTVPGLALGVNRIVSGAVLPYGSPHDPVRWSESRTASGIVVCAHEWRQHDRSIAELDRPEFAEFQAQLL